MKLKSNLQKKHGIASRIFSVILVLAMLITMMPSLTGSNMISYAAGTETNVTVHFMLPNTWGWTTPAVQYWGGAAAISGDSNGGASTEVPGWGGAVAYSLTKGTVGESSTDYSITLKGTFTGFQFLDLSNTSNTVNPAYDAKLSQYKEDTAKDVYYIQKSGSWSYFTDAAGTLPVPELPTTETTFLLVGELPGTAWDQTATPNFVKSQSNENIYSITINNVAAKTYAYKILEDSAVQGWNKPWGSSDNRSLVVAAPANITLSLNKTDTTNHGVDVSVDYIEDLVVAAPAQAQKGQAVTLPATGTYYTGDATGTKTDGVALTYTAVSAGITISGNSLTVPQSYTGTSVSVKASYGGFDKTIIIPVVDKLYNYTIYYYDFNTAHMTADASALWMWADGVNGSEYTFSGLEEVDGNNWLKATVSLPYTQFSVKEKAKGTWSWEGSTRVFNNASKNDNTTLYITSNSSTVYTSVPELVAPRERYVMVEYDRPAGDYEGWNIYTWNSGFGSDVSVKFNEVDGKMVAKIPVKDSTAEMKLSFCMRKSTNADKWAEKDGGDNYITVPVNQSVVKAKFTQGFGITEVLPYNTGYVMDGAESQIHFYYRDDIKFAAGDLASLKGKVSVVIDGTSHEMTYDEANERFSYDLDNIVTGDYHYYYVVDGVDTLDAFNDKVEQYGGKDCNVLHYKRYNMTIQATMSSATMDYNDNNVLSVSYVPADGEDISNLEISEAYADLSALGLKAKTAIDTKLMELSIACLATTTTGVKTIPVTVKDIYGNVYTTNASVTVQERSKASGDFDWDEAVIYFTVTDRFFDGNTSNNDAYGVGDYNTSAATGGSSYHGGDFAGLSTKLDYLQDLGVNTIWITPVVENITEDLSSPEGLSAYGYHGYWASDFTTLNKHLGTQEEFKALLDAAHARNMKIMVDVVLNHAGYNTEDYFNSILTDENGNPIKMIRDASNTVSGDDVLDSLSNLPDFATENEEVRKQVVEWQTEWMENFDIDYYRVDTVKHVDSTTWAAFKNSLTKANPDFKIIGEYSGAGYGNTAGELGSGTMDSLLDFDFNDFAQQFVGGSISSVEKSLQTRNNSINNTATLGSFLGSHDEDGLQYKLVDESGMSETEAYNLMKVAATLQITAKGQPVIYYGEELGQTGANNYPYQTNRYDFDWTELSKQSGDTNSMYNHYKTMLAIRNQYTDVFARGSRSSVAVSDADGYEVISRSYGSDTLYVGMNIKEAAKSVTFAVSGNAGSIYTNLYDGKEYTVSENQTVTISIPEASKGGTIVLAAKAAASGNEVTIDVTGNDFSGVTDAIKDAVDGSSITVNMPDTTTVPADVFTQLAGKDVTIQLELAGGVTWTINGKSVTGNIKNPIDFAVTIGSNSIPSDKLSALAGNNKTVLLALGHEGEFGFDAKLTINVGATEAAKYANLYYYNKTTGKLEYMQAVKVNPDGTVSFDFKHASEYVIVLGDADMNPALTNANTTVNTTPAVTAAVTKTGDATPIAGVMTLLAMALLVLAAGVVAYGRKRHN